MIGTHRSFDSVRLFPLSFLYTRFVISRTMLANQIEELGRSASQMFRKRIFNAMSAGLRAAESSQFSKSLIWTLCSTSGCLMATVTLAGPRLESSLQASSRKQAQRLSYGFIETLRGDLDSMHDSSACRSSSPCRFGSSLNDASTFALYSPTGHLGGDAAPARIRLNARRASHRECLIVIWEIKRRDQRGGLKLRSCSK